MKLKLNDNKTTPYKTHKDNYPYNHIVKGRKTDRRKL